MPFELPQNYEVPQAPGKYLKLKPGEHRFRILTSPIMGYEWWEDKKPLRIPASGTLPDHVQLDEVKHFWAMFVYNQTEKAVQILEITQRSIQKAILSYFKDEDWGDPMEYDIVIVRTGETLNDTEYEVKAKPKSPLSPEAKEAWNALKDTVKMEALFVGDDPFNPAPASPEKSEGGVPLKDIPF